MYRDTVTLFNRSADGADTLWYPTVLHDVHLTLDLAAIKERIGYETGDRAVLNVRFDTGEDGERFIAGKLWLPPTEWRAQPDDERGAALTFAYGEKFDFFMIGEWGVSVSDGGGPVPDCDYDADGGFYGYLNRTHDGVFAVTAVSGPFSVIPHLEIRGR